MPSNNRYHFKVIVVAFCICWLFLLCQSIFFFVRNQSFEFFTGLAIANIFTVCLFVMVSRFISIKIKRGDVIYGFVKVPISSISISEKTISFPFRSPLGITNTIRVTKSSIFGYEEFKSSVYLLKKKEGLL